MDMDRYIGRLLDDRYEILEVIGTGGMSVVYKARCHRLNRLVAIKILKDENLQDEDFRRRFHAESQAVAMLSHPNIVSVYDVSATQDADYIVMELIDGITLKQYMQKKGVLNWKETLHFAIQIAKALEHAHSRGLVHRDIKPHNVMVLKNGAVKVADFGIAQIMTQSNTLTKEALGSVHYISPEQARGGRVDNRSDLYSLGVVMYEMITGRPPYDGDSPVAVAIQHINGGAVPPSEINPNIPRGLEQIIVRAMTRDLRSRYRTAAAMLKDLDEFRKNPDIIFGTKMPAAAEKLAHKPDRKEAEPPVVPVVPEPPAVELPKKEEVVEKSAPKKVAPAPKREKPKYERETGGRGSAATVVIVICSLIAMIAIGVLLVMLIGAEQDATDNKTTRIPTLLNMPYDHLPDYPGIEVIKQSEDYSDTYEAGRIIRQEPAGGTVQPFGSKVFVTVSLGPAPEEIKMPNVVGISQAEAEKKLQDLDLDIRLKIEESNSEYVPEGKIINTEPSVNVKLERGQTVILRVSTGPRTVMAEMPDLLRNGGLDVELSKGMMDRRGFTRVEWLEVESQLPKGLVISQSVKAGSLINVTTRIVIEYSGGPKEPDVPPVPDQPMTINYVFELPTRAEAYRVSIVLGDVAVVIDEIMEPGQNSLAVQLTGIGQMQCTVFIDAEYYETIMVDFKNE